MANQRGAIGTGSPSLDYLRASSSAIDRGAVFFIEAGLAPYRVFAHRLARKALADGRGNAEFGATYLAIQEWLVEQRQNGEWK